MIKWLEDAVFYEVYPQSFRDSNGDGIGDIPGITEKLEYIQELGCNALWINPCFTSPFYDAGYDVEDYYSVAPRYGTNEDLKKLFEAAHQRGMHVLLDLVPGHTAVTHPWFQESMKAEKNEYTDRYVWTDSLYKRMEDVKGIVSVLRGISPRPASCGVNCFSTQPALNYGFANITDAGWQQPTDAPGPMATREELKNIMRFWLTLGCDGFRVDMAGSLVKNDEDKKETIRLWQDVRAFLNKERRWYPSGENRRWHWKRDLIWTFICILEIPVIWICSGEIILILVEIRRVISLYLQGSLQKIRRICGGKA